MLSRGLGFTALLFLLVVTATGASSPTRRGGAARPPTLPLPTDAMVRAGLTGRALPTTARATLLSAADGGTPRVNTGAFRGQGALAFVWNGRPYLFDGQQGILPALPHTGTIADLSWSPDGQWLAYLDGVSPRVGGRLRVVRADGHDARPLTELPGPVQWYAWSSRGHTLDLLLNMMGRSAATFWFDTLAGSYGAYPVAAQAGLLSPDGRVLAYVETHVTRDPGQRSDALDTVTTTGERLTRLFLARQAGIILAGWWPNGKGVLFWLDPVHSRSLAADGLGLYTMPLGGTPRLLTSALLRRLSFSPSGRQIVLMDGPGRELWHAKRLTTCEVETALCHAVPRRPGTVALDPVWSPTGTTWAFVQAQDRGRSAGAFGFTTTSALHAWVQTHTLWVATPQGTRARELPAGTGVYRPQWSGDGRRLLFIRDNALWLIATRGGPPARIVGPFPGTPDLFGFYGAPSWPITFAWNTPAPAPNAALSRAAAGPASIARSSAPPAPLRVLHQVTVAPRGLMPAISGHLVIWLQNSMATPRGRWTGSDLDARDLATGRTFAVTTGGRVVVGAEGTLALPAISGTTVVWADCRACYSTSSLPPFGNVRIYARDLASGRASPVAPQGGLQQWSPALSGHLVIWSQEGGCHPGLYATNLATGRHVFVAPGVGAAAVSGQTVAWLAKHNATWTIDGKNLITGRAFSTPLYAAGDPAHVPSDLLLDGHLAIWTDWQPDHSVVILGKDLATGRFSRVATIPEGHYNPQYGPHVALSGTLVAWDQAQNRLWPTAPNFDIYAHDLRSGRTVRVTTERHDQLWPAISGATIVWEDARTGAWSVRGATLALR